MSPGRSALKAAESELSFAPAKPTIRVPCPLVVVPERRVVGFGDGKVYMVRMDEYGLQYLERYGLP